MTFSEICKAGDVASERGRDHEVIYSEVGVLTRSLCPEQFASSSPAKSPARSSTPSGIKCRERRGLRAEP